jgi:hypothetical protein
MELAAAQPVHGIPSGGSSMDLAATEPDEISELSQARRDRRRRFSNDRRRFNNDRRRFSDNRRRRSARDIAAAIKAKADAAAEAVAAKAAEIAAAAQAKVDAAAEAVKEAAATAAAKVPALTLGVSFARYGMMCSSVAGVVNPDCEETTAGIYFPEVNPAKEGRNDHITYSTSYTGILKYTELMLAFVNSGYKFEGETGNTAPQSQAILRSLRLPEDQWATAGYGPMAPAEMCGLPTGTTNMKGYSDVFHETKFWSEQETNILGNAKWSGHDSQSSTYEIELDDEYLMVYVIRGSESPAFANAKEWKTGDMTVESDNWKSIAQDWFGSDFEVSPDADTICDKPDVKIHAGFQKAYKGHGDTAKNFIHDRLLEIKANTTKTVKLFVTGHSLGAAQGALAAYDFHCHNYFHDSITNDNVYVIVQGQPVLFHGDVSLQTYQSTVPATHRIRQLAVSSTTQHGNTFVTGDMVGMSFPAAGYNQPTDDFLGTYVQARDMKGDQTMGMDCSPQTYILNGLTCHLLDRYNEGLVSRADTYEGTCAATTLESQQECAYCDDGSLGSFTDAEAASATSVTIEE